MAQQGTRKAENAELQFHQGTEDRLAKYVAEHAQQGSPEHVLKTVDQFCWNEHWMMHLGDVKGPIVIDAIKKCAPKIALELGTYCGYSAVMLAQHVSGTYYTIDPYPTQAAVVLLEKAGLQDKVRRLVGTGKAIIPTLTDLKGKVDFVFIDHDKKEYLSDLILIENAGLLHEGSFVVADNVVVFSLQEYRDHVTGENYSSTQLYESRLEYNSTDDPNLKDGVEVSIWRGKK